jgi:hypothetical protein
MARVNQAEKLKQGSKASRNLRDTVFGKQMSGDDIRARGKKLRADADRQAARAKRNRKKLTNFFRRTFSGLKKLASKAAKLPSKASKAIKRATDSIAKAAHSQSKCSPAAAKKRMAKQSHPKPGLESDSRRARELTEKMRRGEKLTKAEIGQAQAIAKEYAPKTAPTVERYSDRTAYECSRAKAERKAMTELEDLRRLEQSPGFRGWDEYGKPIREWTEWMSATPEQQKKSSDAQKRLKAKEALKSVPKEITIPCHQRGGTKGVKAHQKTVTTKKRDQMAAQKLADPTKTAQSTQQK